MDDATAAALKSARTDLGKCAAKMSAISKTRPLTASEKEIVVACGTAHDWVRWAKGMTDIEYSSPAEHDSARKSGIVEAVRFNLLWTATNALFAKAAVMQHILGPGVAVPHSEAARFKELYLYAAPTSDVASVGTLRELLGIECKTEGVTCSIVPGGTPTMWDVIDQKYSRPEDRQRGIGRVIHTALQAGTLPTPDGPTLVYGGRNWAVHGMLLTSFFRGSKKKYELFISHIVRLLSEVLAGAAQKMKDTL